LRKYFGKNKEKEAKVQGVKVTRHCERNKVERGNLLMSKCIRDEIALPRASQRLAMTSSMPIVNKKTTTSVVFCTIY
jgi:hypothetical protein